MSVTRDPADTPSLSSTPSRFQTVAARESLGHLGEFVHSTSFNGHIHHVIPAVQGEDSLSGYLIEASRSVACFPLAHRLTYHTGYRKSWSPNTLKTRLLLNAMQIPYTEQFISYPDIAPLLDSYGVPQDPEEEAYTLPAIYHPESLKGKTPGDKMLSDSIAIAGHLDALYPDAPVHAFPEPKADSEMLWQESQHLLRGLISAIRGKGYRLLMPRIPLILDDRGAEYFIRTRTADHPQNLSPLKWGSEDAEEDWRTMTPYVEAYNAYLLRKRDEANEAGGRNGPFLWGETLSMGDIYLVSVLVWFRAAGQELLDRLLAIGEGEAYKTSPMRDVWDAFERNGWLTAQGEKRTIGVQE